jgi:hypothetical protein
VNAEVITYLISLGFKRIGNSFVSEVSFYKAWLHFSEFAENSSMDLIAEYNGTLPSHTFPVYSALKINSVEDLKFIFSKHPILSELIPVEFDMSR